MFRELWKRKIFIVFAVALFVLFPAASVRPAQASSKTILLSAGIEKTAAGYAVSGTMMKNKLTSAEGATVPDAIQKITANTGREVSFAHCNLIVLGASLSSENVADILLYFLEKFEISNNALLVWVDGSVEKALETSMAKDTASAGGLLETIAAHNQKNVFKRAVTLDAFFKDYYKGQSAGIAAISLVDDEIVNTEQMAVFKDGMFIEIKGKPYR